MSPPPDFESGTSTSDVVIDFSHPSSVLSHLDLCLAMKKSIVIGTTGWETSHDQARQRIEEAKGSCLYSPNFSIGIFLFNQIVAHAAQLLQKFPEYDVAGVEAHHRQKVDSPSGTAKALSDTLLHNMPRLKDFNFSSIRCGSIPGTHTLYFDSNVDTLTLTHEARNREGFAHGAVIGAEWLIGRQGFFTMKDMMMGEL